MGATTKGFSISGPGIDRSYPSASVALSAAISVAEHAAGETTIYVRNPAGDAVGRVERDETRVTRIYRNGGAR